MEVSVQLHTSAAFNRRKIPGVRWIGGWVSPMRSVSLVPTENITAKISVR